MIILMGLAGSGKGTQAKRLADDSGYTTISTGELLRSFATEEQKNRILTGALISDDEIIDMVEHRLQQLPDTDKVLFDGFPRSVAQAEWLLRQVAEGRLRKPVVIHMAIDEATVRARLLSRARSDDTDDGITKRFDEFRKNTVPVINYLQTHGITLHEVNADQPPDDVYADIIANLAPAE